MEKWKIRSRRGENFKDFELERFSGCGHFIYFILHVVIGVVFFMVFNTVFCHTARKTYFLHCFGVAETHRHQNNAVNTFSEPCGKKLKTIKITSF